MPRLLSRLKSELGCGNRSIDFLAYAVRAISADAEADFQEMIESCDVDLQQQAGELLPEHGPMILSPPGRSRFWYWEMQPQVVSVGSVSGR